MNLNSLIRSILGIGEYGYGFSILFEGLQVGEFCLWFGNWHYDWCQPLNILYVVGSVFL